MAFIEGIGDITALLFVIVVAALAWMIKLAYDLKHLVVKRGRHVEGKVALLEGKAVLTRREVVDLHKSLHQKMDISEFDKRMDGLIELVGGRKK
ncbi:MAG: hypothetical protein V1708_00820, partial [Candidatus Micrarchaeota archaeon]